MNIKMMGGVEIHQRLATDEKLFCSCSAQPKDGKPVGEIVRKQRAVAGELGEVDLAALHEYSRDRTYRYQIFPKTTCLVELDEEPPHPMNRDALETVIEVCLLLGSRVVDEVQVMRKTVIDGSNTAGFQRTTIVGLGGSIQTSKGEVGIQTICLEEESSGIVGEKDGEVTYRLDRLGIPLIEIATCPDVKDGEHAREVVEKLGNIVRITGKAQRGIGTIRQDLNISISKPGASEGARVEIKGVQELGLICRIVEREVARQAKLLEEGKGLKSEVRRALSDGETEYMRPMPGSARLYPETDVPPIRISREWVEEIRKKLPERPEDRREKLVEELKIGEELTKKIMLSKNYPLFEKVVNELKIEPKLVAAILEETVVSLRREGAPVEKLNENKFMELFIEYKCGKFVKAAIPEILRYVSRNPTESISHAVDKLKLEKMRGDELGKIVEEKRKAGKSGKVLIGEIMREHRLRVDMKELSALV